MLRVPRIAPREVVFSAMMLAIFIVAVEATIVATALPTIVADLGGLRYFSWVFGSYLLTQAVTIPIYGRLADFFGRKALLIVAIVVFLTGSILCGFAHSMLALILFRALQGIGAGGVQPVSTTNRRRSLPGPRPRARAGLSVDHLGVCGGDRTVAGRISDRALRLAGHLSGSTSRSAWPASPSCCAPITRRSHASAHRIDYLGSALLALGVER